MSLCSYDTTKWPTQVIGETGGKDDEENVDFYDAVISIDVYCIL